MLLRFEDHIDHVDALVRAALDAADPAAALEAAFEEHGEALQGGDVRLIAAGKAAGRMTRALVEGCGVAVVEGVCLAPEGQGWEAEAPVGGVRFFAVDHPIASARNVEAARAAREVALRAANEGGTLVVLLSGGASAHLTLPAEGVSLEDVQNVTAALLRAGAPIEHLNCVRRHCEQLKGGGLLRLARHGEQRREEAGEPAGSRVVTFALSDVIGNRPEAIGSGPTAADPSTYAEALDVLARYGAMEASEPVVRRLERGALGAIPETVKPRDPDLDEAEYHIIASNEAALLAAEAEAERLGLTVAVCRAGVTGDAAEAGADLVRRAAALRERGASGFVVLAGGETTVRVPEGEGGTPRGGRNLHAALSMAVELERAAGAFAGASVAAFSMATDGVDGSSDAAGAIVSSGTAGRARRLGVDPEAALASRESHAFFERVGGLIRTGPTGTNVNDVVGVLVY